jgi:hypothetical protein
MIIFPDASIAGNGTLPQPFMSYLPGCVAFVGFNAVVVVSCMNSVRIEMRRRWIDVDIK